MRQVNQRWDVDYNILKEKFISMESMLSTLTQELENKENHIGRLANKLQDVINEKFGEDIPLRKPISNEDLPDDTLQTNKDEVDHENIQLRERIMVFTMKIV